MLAAVPVVGLFKLLLKKPLAWIPRRSFHGLALG